MKISNYDEFEYDYSIYWKNRNYEHFSEVIALMKMLENCSGEWFLDVGGSYGRHLPLYYSKYKHPVIVDYSLNTLVNNKFRIWEKFPNTNLVAANVYKLPFRDSSFNGSMMVRVLHHLENADVYFQELQRILCNEAMHIQEFANKVHIKAAFKALLKGNLQFFNLNPYQQPTHNQGEGSGGQSTVFLNFHPKDIAQRLKILGFTLLKKQDVSFFRLELIKKIIPIRLLVMFEGLMQRAVSWTSIAPSIFYKLVLKKKTPKEGQNFGKIEDILICPNCQGELDFKKETCKCSKCEARYEKVAGIWDFRVQ
ncbi:class I SAM-dependent methyltransferase [bacterium]|nr:class I SAM-dependent methyltransferase [bacterium]